MTQMRYPEAIEIYERLFQKHKSLPAETVLDVFRTLSDLYGKKSHSKL